MSYSTTDYAPMATAVPVPSPIVPMKPHKEAVSANNETNSLLQRRPRPLDENQVQRLVEQGFTRGLGTSLNHMREVFALRIWIIDNSGSMQKPDGHRIIPDKNREVVKMVPCSRWE
jgi:hypothetical protein